MNTLDAIFNRKTVRSYTGEAITDKELEIILKAANAAPIGRKKYEDVQLCVIKNRELLEKIDSQAAKNSEKPDSHPLYGAPLMIIVSSKIPEETNMKNVVFSNCATVVQNMALCATELGIGACHIWGAVRAINASPEILAELKLDEGFTPCCSIILGKTDEKYGMRDISLDTLKTKIID